MSSFHHNHINLLLPSSSTSSIPSVPLSSSSSPPSTPPSSPSSNIAVIASIISESLKNKNYSIRKACKEKGVTRSTIGELKKEWLNTNPSHSSSFDQQHIMQFITSRRANLRSKQPILSTEQEEMLCSTIVQRSQTANPIYLTSLCEVAHQLFNLPSVPSEHWRRGFISRHPSITNRKPQRLLLSRAAALNSSIVSSFFNDLSQLYSQYSLTDERIFNMDEKGFVGDGGEGERRILVPVEQRNSNCVRNIGFKDHVSILACVSARGIALPPIVCFEGDGLSVEDINADWEGMKITTQGNGYFTQSTLLPVLQHIDSHTLSIKSSSSPILLILDGSTSHLDPAALSFAAEHNIIVYRLPPNTTHRLQPLDRSCFRPFSSFYRKECESLRVRENLPSIKKKHVLPLLQTAWKKAFKRANIVAGFESTGIWPLNPSAITPSDLAPSVPLLPPVSPPSSTDSPSPTPEQQKASELLSTPSPRLSRTASLFVQEIVSSLSSVSSQLKESRKEIVKIEKKLKRKAVPRLKIAPGEVITTPEFIDKLSKAREAKEEGKKKKQKKNEKKRKGDKMEEKEKENVNPNNSSNTPASRTNLSAKLSNGKEKRVRLL